ncbi:MAG: acyl-ACP--UDP-N-acetylglucosamine O-acyltransferase [Burkholderiales bacterium]
MIHATAIVHPDARVAADVEIGPYAIVGAQVQIAAGSSVGAHAVIEGRTRIGRNNRIFAHAVLGGIPQDKKYAGETTDLEIGDGNVIREFCTFNTGTAQDVGTTRIGNQNWIMAYVHVAHDCQIGDHTTIANCTQLAGHVAVGDHAVLGGFTGIHQFCRIGAHAMTGVGSVVLADVPPYVMAMGNTAEPHGINTEGLRRRGFGSAAIQGIRRGYKTLYKSGLTLEEAKQALRLQATECPELMVLLDFLDSSKRSIVR